MTPADFAYIQDLLKREAGISLGQDKMYLVESRLAPVLRQWRFENMSDLIGRCMQKDAKLITTVIDAMTTNETLFFRDLKPFDALREAVLPDLIKKREATRKLRIWSAACSTGQEPYSIALILHNYFGGLEGWNVEILGTDLSTEAITRAKDATYNQFEVQRGLPIQLLLKYFEQHGENWTLRDGIRKKVRFEAANLMKDSLSFGQFDLILCRNVLIYFDEPTKRTVIERLSKQLTRDGYICLGGSESMHGLNDGFTSIPEYKGFFRFK
jgi:chemotaxis protein methyltransferase CheR